MIHPHYCTESDLTFRHETGEEFVPGKITPEFIRKSAAKGHTLEMIASSYNMYEHELQTLLDADEYLKRAYDMGVVLAKVAVQKELWYNQDVGLLLLKARQHLKMDDPVLDALSGDMLKTVLSKMDTKKRKTLANLLKTPS